jgi:putative transcriptional regulator
MRYGHCKVKSLRGQLLLASRRLADPNFFRTVILMIQHNSDGALGLILNRPLEMTVKQACDEALEVACQVQDVLHQGGPCQGPLMALHTHGGAAAASASGPERGGHCEVISGLYFSTERDELEWLLKRPKPQARFFVGYSGWGKGQLESELESGSWMVTPATIQQVFDVSQVRHWTELLTQLTFGQPIKSDLIPDDPSVN